MKKVYKMQNVDCAHCALKMQNNILKISGVSSASINFLTQKLVIELDENNLDEIMKAVLKACKAVDSDVEIVL